MFTFNKNLYVMSYRMDELKALSDAEKIHIIKELLNNLSAEVIEELAYVQECLEAHIENPGHGMSLERFKQYFAEKYGL
jgi:hypothetical protein